VRVIPAFSPAVKKSWNLYPALMREVFQDLPERSGTTTKRYYLCAPSWRSVHDERGNHPITGRSPVMSVATIPSQAAALAKTVMSAISGGAAPGK
jgi:hypothetical protein